MRFPYSCFPSWQGAAHVFVFMFWFYDLNFYWNWNLKSEILFVAKRMSFKKCILLKRVPPKL